VKRIKNKENRLLSSHPVTASISDLHPVDPSTLGARDRHLWATAYPFFTF